MQVIFGGLPSSWALKPIHTASLSLQTGFWNRCLDGGKQTSHCVLFWRRGPWTQHLMLHDAGFQRPWWKQFASTLCKHYIGRWVPAEIVIGCSGFISIVIIKYPERKQLSGKGFILAHSSAWQSIIGGKSQRKKLKTGLSHPQLTAERN